MHNLYLKQSQPGLYNFVQSVSSLQLMVNPLMVGPLMVSRLMVSQLMVSPLMVGP